MILHWWQWLALGLILITLELASSGGFYVIFFGVAAITISLLRLVNLAGPAWVQLLLFAALSIGSLLLFRNPLLRWMKLDTPAPDVDSLLNDTAVPIDDIPAGEVGRAELRGTVWSARNAHDAELARGQRARVQRVDGLTLYLVPER
jgi:inner membrane protein